MTPLETAARDLAATYHLWQFLTVMQHPNAVSAFKAHEQAHERLETYAYPLYRVVMRYGGTIAQCSPIERAAVAYFDAWRTADMLEHATAERRAAMLAHERAMFAELCAAVMVEVNGGAQYGKD